MPLSRELLPVAADRGGLGCAVVANGARPRSWSHGGGSIRSGCEGTAVKAIVLEQPGAFRFLTAPEPRDVPEGHALCRVNRVGICGTDWHAYRGRQPFFTYPRILGHELGVEVVAVNDPSSDLKPGDRCAV